MKTEFVIGLLIFTGNHYISIFCDEIKNDCGKLSIYRKGAFITSIDLSYFKLKFREKYVYYVFEK